MKGQLIFRIFVDISSYPYEIFVLKDFIICSISFVVVHHTRGRFVKSLFHDMGMTNHIIVIIINQIIFTLPINIFCNSYKMLIKSFSNSF